MKAQTSSNSETSYQYEFTVFTCSYNRANTLARTFESLKNQTLRDFEWIVFDNGSTDDTPALVERLASEANFPVTSLRNEHNTGYQNTFNEGVKAAKGRFWVLLDSDDTCVPHALESLQKIWNTIPMEERTSFSGVTVNCKDQRGTLVGNEFPTEPLDSTYVETMYKYRVKGEKWGFCKTDVLKTHPFPTSSEHIFPGVVWREIGKSYKTRYVNKTLRTYYIEEEGRQDQLCFRPDAMAFTATSRRINSLAVLNNDLKWFVLAPDIIVKKAIVYSWHSFYQNIGFFQMVKEVKPWLGKFIAAGVAPAGLLMSLYSKRKANQL